jgi:predicted ATPase/signal transduction histidine kinase
LAQGIRNLFRQLLTESAEQLAAWREKIQQAVGRNGQVLIELLPELQHILGPQPTPAPLPPEEARHRFKHLFQNLVLLFAQPQHPLVVVVDDMQWADVASLEMIEQLLVNGRGHLLFIGMYRHEEVNEVHPLSRLLAKLEEAKQEVGRIHLHPLTAEDIQAYVADAVGRPEEETAELGLLLERKTAGNPFFMGEFLKELYTTQVLVFNHTLGRWQWNLKKAELQGMTNNVVALMTQKVARLTSAVQDLFKLAACMGIEFELHLLAKLTRNTPQETAKLLWPALMEELIVPLDSTYNLAHLDAKGALEVRYRFVHDRVQEAAYLMLGPAERSAAHWQIGQLLLQDNYLEKNPARGLFVVVNQLNLSWEHADTAADKLTLAQLNWQAAQKTKQSAAFQAAYDYTQMGLRLLPPSSWQTDYALTRDLHTEAVQCAYLCHQHEAVWQWSNEALPCINQLLEQIPIYEVQIQILFAQHKFQEALQLGLERLKDLGVVLSQDMNETEITNMFAAVAELWQVDHITSLLHLPPMTDAHTLTAMRLLIRLQPMASVVAPAMQPLLILNMVRLSLVHGNAPSSCLAYATYGNLLILRFDNVEVGYKFGQLALAILHHYEAREFETRVHFLFNGFIRFRKEPLLSSLDSLVNNYHHGRETGDYVYGFGSIILYAIHALGTGKNVAAIERDLALYQQEAQYIKSDYVNNIFPIYRQGFRALLGQTAAPTSLSGDEFDEEAVLAHLATLNNNISRAVIYMFKLILAYQMGDYEQAHTFAREVDKFKHLFWGTYWYVQFTFYDSLVRAALLNEEEEQDEQTAASHTQRIAENQQKLAEWATHTPSNFLPQWHLVEAERLRHTTPQTQARQHYDQAIELAQQYENRHIEALALEKAAEFHLQRGQTRLASYYMSDAHYLYGRWDARLKAKQVQRQYPQLVLQRQPEAGFGTIRTSFSSTSSRNMVTSALDLLAIIQATQAIASEVVEETLHARLMQVMLEGMPVQRGLLLLPHTADEWHIAVEGRKNAKNKIELRPNLPLIPASAPLMLTNYVMRTHESLVLNDIVHDDPRLADDPYMAYKRVRAAVCLPLVNRGELRGVLYLENTVATGVFTDNHIALLHIMASQAAVALDNAQLYQNLEQRVAARTAELQGLVSELDAFSHTVAHDLKSPLSGIIGYAEIIGQEMGQLTAVETQELLQRVIQSGLRMRHIIDGLLTLATTRAGDVPLTVLDMESVVQDQKERLFYALAESKAQLVVASEWPMAVGHEAWVGEVWANYISNAIKYGGAPPRIELGADVVDEETARFWVRDNGQGLTAEQCAKLFTPFTQLGEHRADSHGLGLSIAQRIIERLGGEVGVESEVGEGSLFYFTLPLE